MNSNFAFFIRIRKISFKKLKKKKSIVFRTNAQINDELTNICHAKYILSIHKQFARIQYIVR